MLKMIKDRDRFKNYMNDILKLTPAYERLCISVLGVILFCHIAACIWYMLVGLGDSAEDWLSSNKLEEMSKFDVILKLELEFNEIRFMLLVYILLFRLLLRWVMENLHQKPLKKDYWLVS